jgi:hypothetical protein
MSAELNIPLIIGNLDVQKAFDTVPTQARIMSMRRIKIPETFLSLIMKMEEQRSLTV